ncbi:MAG: ABC transporter permease [Methanoculleus marisnigri]|nr:ABC transporter permease [Methanoculleus marisnigri]
MSGDAPMKIDLSRVAIIARKEFADHLTDRTFLLVLALFGILTLFALERGLASYTNAMEWYVFLLERAARADHLSTSPFTSSPNLPSVLWIFLGVGEKFLLFGPLLAIAVGFDLISGERSTRSLRMLLSRPVYRDEVITGKAVGGAVVLVLASAVPFILALGAVLVAGLTVTPHDAAIVVLCWGATILYLLAYFGVAVAFSAFSEDGGRALAWAMAIFILFSAIVPVVAESSAVSAAGPIPAWPGDNPTPDEVQQYLEERNDRSATYDGVKNTILALSPNGNYETMIKMLGSLHSGGGDGGAVAEESGLKDVLGRFWQNIVGLVAFPMIFLAVAYVRFMRLDLR